MKTEIVPCGRNHVEACVALAVKAGQAQQAYKREVLGEDLHAVAMYGWQEALEKAVREQQTGDHAFVLLEGGAVAAFGAYKSSGAIGSIGICEATSADAQEQLLKYLLEDMKKNGITHAMVNWENCPSSAAARTALERVGFEKYLPHVRYFQTLGEAPGLPETELQILPAEEAHIEDCVRIAIQVWSVIHDAYANTIGRELHDAFNANWQERHRVNIANHIRNTKAVVAVLDGKVVGFCGSRVENGILGVIGYNGVDPEYRGRGIARYMYEAAFDSFRSQRIRCARVFTGGDDGHGPARRAYEKAGFNKRLLSVTYYRTL